MFSRTYEKYTQMRNKKRSTVLQALSFLFPPTRLFPPELEDEGLCCSDIRIEAKSVIIQNTADRLHSTDPDFVSHLTI